MTLVFLVE